MSLDPFEDFEEFSNRVLGGVDRGDRSAQKFKFLLGVISQALVATHTMVMARVTAVEDASSADEAARAIDSLRSYELTEAFRIEGLCDTLGGLGEGLDRRTRDARSEGLFQQDELDRMETFAQMLLDREAELAAVYSGMLAALTSMTVSDGSLPAVKQEATALRMVLTSQISDFAAKAQRFTSLT